MQSDLERVLQLAKKTGDRIIVFDKKNPYVVMNFDEYERLIDDFDDDFSAMDINWDNENEGDFADISEENLENNESLNFNENFSKDDDDYFDGKLDNYDDYDNINSDFPNTSELEKSPKKRWEIAPDVKQAGREELSDTSRQEQQAYDDSQMDDERYYLETI